jgi:hypothetical protein
MLVAGTAAQDLFDRANHLFAGAMACNFTVAAEARGRKYQLFGPK